MGKKMKKEVKKDKIRRETVDSLSSTYLSLIYLLLF